MTSYCVCHVTEQCRHHFPEHLHRGVRTQSRCHGLCPWPRLLSPQSLERRWLYCRWNWVNKYCNFAKLKMIINAIYAKCTNTYTKINKSRIIDCLSKIFILLPETIVSSVLGLIISSFPQRTTRALRVLRPLKLVSKVESTWWHNYRATLL